MLFPLHRLLDRAGYDVAGFTSVEAFLSFERLAEVRCLLVDGTDSAPLSWAELWEEGKYTPPFEPIATWRSRLGPNHFWSWSPQWEAAVGRALAHLLAASEGRPVTVPDGLSKEVFQRALDALLPAGPPARRAVLAGRVPVLFNHRVRRPRLRRGKRCRLRQPVHVLQRRGLLSLIRRASGPRRLSGGVPRRS